MMLPKKTKKQKKMLKYLLKHPYSIAAVDPRLGKTSVIIELQKRLGLNCLVICPSFLVPNWKKEIDKWNPNAIGTYFKKGKEIYEPCDSDFVVIGYQLGMKAEHLFDWADMVVFDESHLLKNQAAKVTQYYHKVVYEYSLERVHPMTGTILKNRVHEFYSPMALMYYNPKLKNPKFLKRYPDEITFADKFSYREEFKVKITDKKGRTYRMPVVRWKGLKNLKLMKKYLKNKYIRIKADPSDLPPISFQKILISENNDKELLKAFNAYFEGEGTGSVRPDIKVEAALKKVPFTIKYAESLLESAECILIYSDHVQSIEKIAAHFKVPAITGKMPGKKRAKLAQEFQSGNGRILCATIGALKEGQDLFRSKDLVFNDQTWTPGDLKQVINRIRGLGQKEPRVVHEILGSPQDLKIAEAVLEKIDTIERAT